jgi:hypothetical protein
LHLIAFLERCFSLRSKDAWMGVGLRRALGRVRVTWCSLRVKWNEFRYLGAPDRAWLCEIDCYAASIGMERVP